VAHPLRDQGVGSLRHLLIGALLGAIAGAEVTGRVPVIVCW